VAVSVDGLVEVLVTTIPRYSEEEEEVGGIIIIIIKSSSCAVSLVGNERRGFECELGLEIVHIIRR